MCPIGERQAIAADLAFIMTDDWVGYVEAYIWDPVVYGFLVEEVEREKNGEEYRGIASRG